MDQEKIGKFIKKLRKDQNLTQDELAKKLGVTYQAVSKWETGKSLPDIAILKNISNLFKVNIDDLIEGNLPKKKKISRKKVIFIAFLGITAILILSFFLFHKETYEFKVLETNNDDFDVSGVLTFSKDKSSIYISNINYNKQNNTQYKKISCNLYDVNGESKTKISTCTSTTDNLNTLDDLLKKVTFKIDDYASSCKLYKNNQLVLEINAINKDNNVITYDIPLKFEDNCPNSTNS